MIVCVCRRVSDRDISAAVRDGAMTFDALQFDTGVATQCGRCNDCAHEVFQSACRKHLSGLHAAVGHPTAASASPLNAR
ncbi:ferredoxin [Vitreoscilla filiformis]|uniref:Bacterioferritin-associated ferredoxin n=1 Tax=Vitreoscilla filiformis TaxID=63 RepID=A0A221KAV7_VITFI|nr:(2Fe-2S)-binding protein [Vitreoscilla filiformis]ASM76164.1 ferredoxin [Vitreoscilla filiformis]